MKVGDLVVFKSAKARKDVLRVDGFVLDAMGKKYVALSGTGTFTGRGEGCVPAGSVKVVEEKATPINLPQVCEHCKKQTMGGEWVNGRCPACGTKAALAAEAR